MTRIESIVNPDGTPGASYNAYTGCRHGLDICATSPTCWARTLSGRFQQICGGDFLPRFHAARLNDPRHWRKPRRVAVCFLGDLFGDWAWCEWPATAFYPEPGAGTMFEVKRRILEVVRQCPQHTFLFLTKRPENLARHNPWPANAWVGCSITGAESRERQAAMMDALERVEGARKRWVSYEPLLAMPYRGPPSWLDWMVVGKASGPGAVLPLDTWVEDLLYDAELYGIPIWLKEKTARALGLEPRKELP